MKLVKAQYTREEVEVLIAEAAKQAVNQERELLARTIRALPVMDSDVKQGWIENPASLGRILSRSLCPPKWREENGIIICSVTSDGTTGKSWMDRLERKKFQVGRKRNESDFGTAEDLLLSHEFRPTSGRKFELAILPDELIPCDKSKSGSCEVSESDIITEANRRNLLLPNAEVACYLREMFLDEDIERMGKGMNKLVIMHKPFRCQLPNPNYFDNFRFETYCGGGGQWLTAGWAKLEYKRYRGCGYVFLTPAK